MYEKPRFLAAGDSALVVEFGNSIAPEINAAIREFVTKLNNSQIKGVLELVPTYRSVLIYFDPLTIKVNTLKEELQNLLETEGETNYSSAYITTIPVCYGGEFGPDLDHVATYNGLSKETVIKRHHSTAYLIYMMGFLPGFPYLGGMDISIATPRLESPRTKIPGGSVGIAGKQTGVYPIESPGGWQIIGRTPLKLYNPDRNPPMLLAAGNYIQFHSINEEEYHKILKEVEEGIYQVQKAPHQGSEAS
ncbi:5-oxoprolinase subunit PxpB [Natranaerobius trueperi]|uniref:Allophanate hydrolase n=1 Tax=Natranaerobius trueperi TaxID=759412 RepID=A0A226BUY2_9FIRM|nr:5-oxoprolinase subunit PxpB [Natranaerobius trueperi]OWZ82848.1 allophanate hydrolase [Natranaerobius trueperi]